MPAGVHAKVIDGDRSLELRVDRGVSLLVRGLLREPMLSFQKAGVFANRTSPTVQADRIANSGSGWQRVASGRSFAWHEHRLSPHGPVGGAAIPVEVGGRRTDVVVLYTRVARPSLRVWLAAGVVLGAAIAFAASLRRTRRSLTIALGVAAGLAALAVTVAFALRDRPAGGIALLPLATAAVVTLALGIPLLQLHGIRRVHAAGVTGAVAAAVTIAALPVFWHGVVISALGADLVRALCGVALVGGASAAVVSLLPEAA